MYDNTEEYCRECQHPHVNERLRAENHKLKEMNTQDNTAPEAKHTPGPWHYAYNGLGSHVVYSTDGSGLRICEMQQGPLRANAEFIASAPELKAEVAELRKENERLKGALLEQSAYVKSWLTNEVRGIIGLPPQPYRGAGYHEDKTKENKTMEKGQKVVVNDPGLIMLQRFAPKGSRPNNVGWIESVEDDGTVMVMFPIGDDDPEEHSQVAPYPKNMVQLKDW